MEPTTESIAKAQLEFRIRDTINQLFLLASIIPDRETAVNFNRDASAPLFRLRKRFEMASGNVVKVRAR